MSIDTLRAGLADRYRIERELGAGGMATVYLAQDVKHDRKVAIKVLRPELAAVIGAERFLSEIKTTANLQHPHILSLFDSGTIDGTVFYVMPFVDGESLRDLLMREKQLPVDEAIRVAREVADALQYAHAHGIIHRDIKPENILIQGGHALVADFGIALAASKTGGSRMTETGMSLGTPQYMSPEQAMGERELDARTDVYALGCVTYEMLTGEPPFTGPTAQAIVARVLTEPAPSARSKRASVPDTVDAAIRTALQKTPADRFRSAAEFATALAETRRDEKREQREVNASRSLFSRLSSLVAVIVIVAIVAALGGAWFGGRRVVPDAGLQFARQLTFDGNVTAVAITADGKSLAYVTDDCLGQVNVCNLTLRVRDVDGTQSLAIAKSWRTIVEVKWSPDGSRLAIRGSPDSTAVAVYLTDKLGGSLQPLRVEVNAMAFTGDSRFITLAVGTARQSLQRFDVATLARVDSVPLPAPWSIRDLDYAPDQKRMIVTVQSAAGGSEVLALLSAKGRVIDSLIETGAARNPIRWSPNGSALYTFEFAPGVADNLVRIPISGDRIDTLGRSIALGQVNDGIVGLFDVSHTGRFAIIAGQQSWGLLLHTGAAGDPWRTISHRTGYMEPWGIAPNGNGVVAAATDNLSDNIASFSFDSTVAPQSLTATRGLHEYPEWSPDGKHVGYISWTATLPWLVTINASGGVERRIVPDNPKFTWISDSTIAVLSNETVRIVDTAGHVRSEFALPAPFRPADVIARPIKDPSSSRIAYPSDVANGIVIVDIEKKTFTQATRSQSALVPVAWSADGLALFAWGTDPAPGADGQRARRLFRFPLSGGPPSVVVTLPPYCEGVVADTDARHVVCEMHHFAPDVWLADKAGRSGW
ncbi:MAG TPA: protein kinase [Gemmatimonadales bacterium]|jgi:dipeptidyl aminopeptidase/acylaminoacyl peptidase